MVTSLSVHGHDPLDEYPNFETLPTSTVTLGFCVGATCWCDMLARHVGMYVTITLHGMVGQGTSDAVIGDNTLSLLL